MPRKLTKGPKETFGLKAFNQAVASLKSAGVYVPAARFQEALRQRRRLMKALRKVDPENPVLADLDKLDGRKPAPAALAAEPD